MRKNRNNSNNAYKLKDKSNVLTDITEIPSSQYLENIPIDILSRERKHELIIIEEPRKKKITIKEEPKERKQRVKDPDSDESIFKETDNEDISSESEGDNSKDEDWCVETKKHPNKKSVKRFPKQEILSDTESDSGDSEILSETESDSETLSETESDSIYSEDEEWVIKKSKPATKKNVKSSTNSKKNGKQKVKNKVENDSDSYEMSSYEKMVEARRAEKLALLQSLGISEVKAEISKECQKPKETRIKKQHNYPPRKSRRLAEAKMTVGLL